MAKSISNLLKAVIRSNRGATAVEYGLIAALVAGAIAIAVGAVGDGVNTALGTATTAMTSG